MSETESQALARRKRGVAVKAKRYQTKNLEMYLEVLRRFNRGESVKAIMNWLNLPKEHGGAGMKITSPTTVYKIRDKALAACQEEFAALGSLHRHMLLNKCRQQQLNLINKCDDGDVNAINAYRELVNQEMKLLGLDKNVDQLIVGLGAKMNVNGSDDQEQDYSMELMAKIQKIRESQALAAATVVSE